MSEAKYYGLYRGVVVANSDMSTKTPRRGRIKVKVPSVYGDILDSDLPWAEPCSPVFGGSLYSDTLVDPKRKVSHGCVAVPPLGSSVWVMFEQGDPLTPVWLGTWWGYEERTKQSEFPQEAVRGYPDVFLLKAPWAPKGLDKSDAPEGQFVRILGSESFEIAYHDDRVFLKFDGLSRKVRIWASGFDVELKTKPKKGFSGNISLICDVPQFPSDGTQGDVLIQARNIQIKATGNISVEAGGVSEYRATGSNTFSSGSAIYGSSPHASGFEDH
jgi:hypothetical protein